MKAVKLFICMNILFLGFYPVYSMEVNRPSPQEIAKIAFLRRSYEHITEEFGKRIQVSPELRKKLTEEEIKREKRSSIAWEVNKEDKEEDEGYDSSAHALFEGVEFEGL